MSNDYGPGSGVTSEQRHLASSGRGSSLLTAFGIVLAGLLFFGLIAFIAQAEDVALERVALERGQLVKRVSDSARWNLLDSIRAVRDSQETVWEDSMLVLRIRVLVLEGELRAVEAAARR